MSSAENSQLSRAACLSAVFEPLEPRRLFNAQGVMASDTVTHPVPVTVNDAVIQFGRVGKRTVAATATDPISGSAVTFRFTGKGTGTVASTSDGLDVTIAGAGDASSLTVTSAGSASLHNVSVGGSINKINAAAINLTGNLTVSGGVGSLSLANVSGQHEISIGAGHGAGRLVFQSINQLSIDSLEPIASLTAQQWIEDPASRGHVTAPYFGDVMIAGDFEANLTATDALHGVSLGALAVNGAIDGAQIRTLVSVQKIIAASLINSNILAGIRSGVNTLPASDSDFSKDARIGEVDVRGPVGSTVVAGSNIAARTIGTIALGPIASSNSGVAFGVASERITSYQRGPIGAGSAGKSVVFKKLRTPGVIDTKGDYLLTIL